MAYTSKQVEKIISVASLAGGGTTESAVIDLTHIRSCALTIRLTYATTATTGATVSIYSPADGTNFDTEAYFSFTPAFLAGGTKQETRVFSPDVKYIKVSVKNNDPTNAISNLSVHLIKGIQA